jgi:hypothetical protein
MPATLVVIAGTHGRALLRARWLNRSRGLSRNARSLAADAWTETSLARGLRQPPPAT